MKLLIASDIHGDADCCASLLKRADIEGVERIVLLGDLLYHGPRNDLPRGYDPKKVIDLLSKYKEKLICVRGNCDTEVDQMVLPFPIMSELGYIYDGDAKLMLFLSHGHIYSPEKLPPISGNAIFLYGHTHIYGLTEAEGIKCFNPGSVSLPKEKNPKTYAIYESGKLEIKQLNGKFVCDYTLGECL